MQRQSANLEIVKEGNQKSMEDLRDCFRKLLASREEERQSVSLALNEKVGQMLTAIKYDLEKNFSGDCEGLEEDRPRLEKTVRLIQKAVEEVRSVSASLRPDMLDDLGILAALSWLTREYTKRNPSIRLQREIWLREDEVPEGLKIFIYRIIQEALENVARHSQASLVRISLWKVCGVIELLIEDDGRGFDLHQPLRGLGLVVMEEMAGYSRGSLIVKSERGGGTVVRAVWANAF